MRELTKSEYIELFGTGRDKPLRMAIDVYNASHPERPVQITTRRVTGAAMVYREQLPPELECQLQRCESEGAVYVGGFLAALPRKI